MEAASAVRRRIAAGAEAEVCGVYQMRAPPYGKKVFCFFSSEKKNLLS
jgi:hypothetical protein